MIDALQQKTCCGDTATSTTAEQVATLAVLPFTCPPVFFFFFPFHRFGFL
jgi:hypothetical protein